MKPIKSIPANPGNYGGKRPLSNIKYIVIHYTANDGDTDENNGKYYQGGGRDASAHYFVDSDSITQSVPDDTIAWSVDGNRYSDYRQTGGASLYGVANNNNTLNIEICDDVRNGAIYPSAAAIQNALELTREKMRQYNIPVERVIRHFDVTGKYCPAYWSATPENNAKWLTEFRNKLTTPEINMDKISKIMVVTKQSVTTRTGNGTQYADAGTLDSGTYVAVDGDAGEWYHIKDSSRYISKSDCTEVLTSAFKVKLSENVSRMYGAGSQFAKIGSFSKGSAVTIDAVEGKYGHTAQNKDWVDLTDTKTVVVVAKQSVATRTGAGVNHSSAGTLDSGTYVAVDGEVNGWYHIKESQRFINKADCVGVVKGYTVKTTSEVPRYYGTSESYSRIGTFKKGDAVTIDAKKDRWGHVAQNKDWICLDNTMKV